MDDFSVRATDSAGNRVADPSPDERRRDSIVFHGIDINWIGYKTEIIELLDPGKSQAIPAINLMRYLRLETPGEYTVTVTHEFLDAPSSLSATATVTIAEPTEAEARKIVEELAGRQTVAPGDREPEVRLNSDWCLLRDPIYLPLLLPRAEQGSADAVVGIGSIATPAATRALVHLLDSPHPETATEAEIVLQRRLPSGSGDPVLVDRMKPTVMFQQTYLAERSYLPEFGPAIRAHAQTLLTGDSRAIARGAHILAFVGTADDLPGLAHALDGPKPGTSSFPVYRVFDGPALDRSITDAIATMALRGVRTAAQPRTLGEQAAFLISLQTAETIKGFQESPAEMDAQVPLLESDNVNIEELAWNSLSGSPPAALRARLHETLVHRLSVGGRQVPTREIQLAGALNERSLAPQIENMVSLDSHDRDRVWEQAVVQRALFQLRGHTAYYNLLLGKLSDPAAVTPERARTAEALNRLSLMFTSPTDAGHAVALYSGDDIPTFQRRWRAFVAAHAAEIEAGHQWKATDPDVPAGLFAAYETLK